MCTPFVYVVKYYGIGDLYTIKLDLFYICRLYHQIWISGTNKDMDNIKMNLRVMSIVGLALVVLNLQFPLPKCPLG
jgi:hypothetical protein